MANVLLKWDALPDTTDDVDGIRVYRVVDTGTVPTSSSFVDDNAVPTDAIPATSSQLTDITGITGTEFVDKGVATGDYYYGVYSYNAAGFSAASITSKIEVT